MSSFVEKSGKAPDAPPKEEAQHAMTAQKQQEADEKPAVSPHGMTVEQEAQKQQEADEKPAVSPPQGPSHVPADPAPAPTFSQQTGMKPTKDKPSIKEMKAAIVAAGLSVADLVEKSDVVERYRQALDTELPEKAAAAAR